MAEEIPAVDAAEVEALARAADQTYVHGPSGKVVAQAPLQGPVGAPISRAEVAAQAIQMREEDHRAEPKGALETLVEQAVAARFDDLRDDMRDLKRWLRHTMHLCMTLANRFAIEPEETDLARRKVDAADAAIRKE